MHAATTYYATVELSMSSKWQYLVIGVTYGSFFILESRLLNELQTGILYGQKDLAVMQSGYSSWTKYQYEVKVTCSINWTYFVLLVQVIVTMPQEIYLEPCCLYTDLPDLIVGFKLNNK